MISFVFSTLSKRQPKSRSIILQIFMHPLKGTLSREKITFYEGNNFLAPSHRERRHVICTSSRVLHQHHCRVFYRFWSLVSLLYHAPIRIKVVREDHPAGEKEQGHADLQYLLESSLLVRTGNPCPLLRTQKIVGSRPCPKGINFHG